MRQMHITNTSSPNKTAAPTTPATTAPVGTPVLSGVAPGGMGLVVLITATGLVLGPVVLVVVVAGGLIVVPALVVVKMLVGKSVLVMAPALVVVTVLIVG